MSLIALAVISIAGPTIARPSGQLQPLSSRDSIPTFPAGTTWDIVLSEATSSTIGQIRTASTSTYQTIDLDLFDTSASNIASLSASGKQVICYFSAGSQEAWRPDAGEFRESDLGLEMEGWPGERWVDVTSENVKGIMKRRLERAREKGCVGVDPDNVDGFSGRQDGFTHGQPAYADYVKYLAREANAMNLAAGLKNAVDLIPDVVDCVQFAINEQCHEYDECAAYKPFTEANKAVFNIEYGGSEEENCRAPAGVKLSTLVKRADQELSTLGGACGGGGGGVEEPAEPEQPEQPEEPEEPEEAQEPKEPEEGEDDNDKPEYRGRPWFWGWGFHWGRKNW